MTPHVVPVKIYLRVFVALLALTSVTVAAAFFDLGGGRLHLLNALVAITIAATKATLVALYFMHLRTSSRFTWVVAGAGVLWLLILLSLTLSDVLTRPWLPIPPPWSSGPPS